MIAAMTTIELVGWLGLLAGCVALSAIFSGMETGIYLLNKIRLDLRAEAGRRPAAVIRRLVRNTPNLIVTLMIGNNIVNYGATFAISALYAGYFATRRAEIYTLLTAIPLLFIFADSIPKNVFQRRSETLTYRLAWLLSAAHAVLNYCGLVPLVQGFSTLLLKMLRAGRKSESQQLARQRLLAVVAEGHAGGVLTHSQSIMAERIMHIAEVTLGDVMIPMSKVAKAPAAATAEQIMPLIREQNHSRLPLLDDRGQVTAVLDIFDVLTAKGPVAPQELATRPLFLPATMIVTDALYRMQWAHCPMAVVFADDGGHVGIVTIKDLVEEIVGEIEA